MPITAVGPVNLPGATFETWLLRFDRSGACVSPNTKSALLSRLTTGPKTPVILFSHGWNNEFEDASALYARFLSQLEALLRKYPSGSEPPLFVGVIWPSTWLSFDQGPRIAAVATNTGAAAAEASIKEDLAAAINDPADREQLYDLLDRPRLTADEAKELARLVAVGLKVALGDGATDGAEEAAPERDTVLAGLNALQELIPAASDDDELEEGGTISGDAPPTPQDAGLLQYLDPRWALRLASVYQMKDRAGTVGARGVSTLLREILGHTQAPLHTVGHSYGAKVILSAIAASDLPRPVETVLLLQPAISHLSFADSIPGRDGSGGYHAVPGRVARSILMTYSGYDFPLHNVFHRALRRAGDLGELRIAGAPTAAGNPPNVYAALGGYGPRGAGELLVEPLPEPGQALALPTGPTLIGFDGTADRRVTGHGDVTTPFTAWLLYSQMLN